MELKYAMGNDNFKEIVCSNRTFMELKCYFQSSTFIQLLF